MKAVKLDESELKDSGIKWIGEYPKKWSFAPAAGMFDEVKEKNKDVAYINPFSFKYGEIVDKDVKGEIDDDIKETISNYTVVKPNTIMINGLNLNYDFITQRVAIVKNIGVITSAYLAVKPNEERINPYFAVYLLKSYDAQQVFHGLGSGVRKTLKFQDFKNIFIAYPSLDEQQIIAKYLDDHCAKIDAIIAEAKASIEEYQELKQAVIYEAVTKGLDENMPMKDSKNIWYGTIPKNWEIHKVCWDYSVELGKMLDQKRITGNNLHPYLRNVDIKWDSINFDELPEMDFSDEESERYTVKPGDLMICEGGEIGKCNIIPINFPIGIYYQKALHRVRAYNDESNISTFLRYVIMFLSKSGYLNDSAQKATIFHLPAEKLKAMRIPSPPIKEQIEIVKFLDKRMKDINGLISEKQSLIEDLEAYKKSLIYEVVTGKRKVVA